MPASLPFGGRLRDTLIHTDSKETDIHSVFFLRNRTPVTVLFPLLCAAIVLLSAASATAPLSGIDLKGEPVNLAQIAPGQVKVLIFVRTDCPISNRYAPALQRLASKYSQKAKFWLVYADKSESDAGIEHYLRDYGYKQISAIRDPRHELVKAAHAQITPEAAVFDANSRLLYHGRIDNWYESFGHARPEPTTHELQDAIDAALESRAVAVAETKAVGCYISDIQ
jgi:thiol-disulfide isomerase/thioredoxin